MPLTDWLNERPFQGSRPELANDRDGRISDIPGEFQRSWKDLKESRLSGAELMARSRPFLPPPTRPSDRAPGYLICIFLLGSGACRNDDINNYATQTSP